RRPPRSTEHADGEERVSTLPVSHREVGIVAPAHRRLPQCARARLERPSLPGFGRYAVACQNQMISERALEARVMTAPSVGTRPDNDSAVQRGLDELPEPEDSVGCEGRCP